MVFHHDTNKYHQLNAPQRYSPVTVGTPAASTTNGFDYHSQARSRSATRNFSCLPSDDESDREDDLSQSSDDEYAQTNHVESKRASMKSVGFSSKPARKTQPLPSDAEDSDDESDHQPLSHQQYRYAGDALPPHNLRQQQRPTLFSTRSDSIPLQETGDGSDDNQVIGHRSRWSRMHTSQPYTPQVPLIQYQYQRLQQQQQYQQQQQQPLLNKRSSLSGMELLMQREQDKLDAKRQKPKVAVKIEGLLAKLPEPGALNISFQQLQHEKTLPKSQDAQRCLSRPSSTATFSPGASSSPYNSSKSNAPYANDLVQSSVFPMARWSTSMVHDYTAAGGIPRRSSTSMMISQFPS
ncbi:uncharacterized protein BYT42DRAFT_16757 [Radiomyces spectabilis]|uniref:uncharacterized protein n=1 Tax=Radiomyces spectabilis TaxID=64574 RepID=UPI00221F0A03|nr:uncharacterized protein BYT42DRAFT_16757 [Radiomyces spectabilis]KAI8393723.1 hypothetical protein BYT42DRAFT_16757 [Radiomyces spectabilis]